MDTPLPMFTDKVCYREQSIFFINIPKQISPLLPHNWQPNENELHVFCRPPVTWYFDRHSAACDIIIMFTNRRTGPIEDEQWPVNQSLMQGNLLLL